MSKLLSIVIPTKDRYQTLFPVITNIRSQLDMSFCEIIISDNTKDNTDALSFLKNYSKDTGLVYKHTVNPLSMVENTEVALSLVKGEYILFIGDDDFVSPYIIDVVKDLKKRNIQCLTYPIANYFYKNVEFRKKYAFNNPATLQVTKNSQLLYEKKRSSKELAHICDIGAIYISGLPRLYHGIISQELLKQLKATYGKFIPGPCPDMTISVALALHIEEYYYLDYPVSISGASSNSEGGKGPTNKHVVKLEDKKWLNQEDVKDWDKFIPKIFSRETIWAQCVSHVFKLHHSNYKLNYQKIYSSMIRNCPNNTFEYVKPLYFSYLKDNTQSKQLYYKDLLYRFIKRLVFIFPSILLELLVSIRGDYKRFNCIKNIDTIDECVNYLKINYKPKF